MFADSFSVVSIYCVAWGSDASFLYSTSDPHGVVVPCDSIAFLYVLVFIKREAQLSKMTA